MIQHEFLGCKDAAGYNAVLACCFAIGSMLQDHATVFLLLWILGCCIQGSNLLQQDGEFRYHASWIASDCSDSFCRRLY